MKKWAITDVVGPWIYDSAEREGVLLEHHL